MPKRLETRVGIAYATTLVAFLLATLAAVWAFRISDLETDNIHDNYVPSMLTASNLLLDLQRMETSELMSVTPGANLAVTRSRLIEASHDFQVSLTEADRLSESPEERTLYASMEQGFGQFKLLDRQIKTLLDGGRLADAQSLVARQSPAIMRQFRQDVRAFADFNYGEAARAREAQQSARREAEWGACVLAVLGFLLGGFLWRRTTRQIVVPLQELRAATNALERGETRFATEPIANETEELRDLQQGFNAMAVALQQTKLQLQSANTNLEQQVAQRTQDLQGSNAKLERLVQELRELDKLKSEFMAITSHELLTPINYIVGFGAALEDGTLGSLTEDQGQAVGKILEGAGRLTRMVRNTLDYTSLEGGVLPIQMEEVDFAAIVGDTLERFQPAARARRQRLELHLPDDPPLAWADPNRVEQLLGELLDNAIKFTPEGGRIRVTVRSDGDRLVTEVADSGPGIAAEDLPRLCQPFFQVDTSSTRRHGGMGLGLALASKLATAMGGSFRVESRLAQGSTFQFVLRRVLEHVPAAVAR